MHIFYDGELVVAAAAQDRRMIELLPRPALDAVIRMFLMAFVARIIPAAAFELDRDNILFGMIMNAPCRVIHDSSIYAHLNPLHFQ